jgi:hypothetical protein
MYLEIMFCSNLVHIFSFVVRQPISGLDRLFRILDRTRIHARTHLIGLLQTSDQLISEAATYATHNKHKRRTSMLSEEFELAIPAFKRLQAYFLDPLANGIGRIILVY